MPLNRHLHYYFNEMKKIIITLIIVFPFVCHAGTITVKKDGTGNYLGIQQAIDHAIWPGDTILVWPGTYYENIDFNGKSLVLGSLLITTGDQSYKYNTIIDGGRNGSCVTASSGEEVSIIGFTIINGKADYGGGINVRSSKAEIKSNVINKNLATKFGGGFIISFDAFAALSNNIISNNHAYLSGGGILVSVDSQADFDSISRNSVYFNFAERGCDICNVSNTSGLDIYLDTCTVLYPDSYYIISINESGTPTNNLLIDIDNFKLTPHDGDIYVNPTSGNNNNTGTSWEEPLKSIAWAYSKIAVDSTDKNTIHLASGIYSDTTNDEKFPLNIRPFINVVGQSMNGVVLDGNRNTYILKGNITDYSLQSMTLQGGPKPKYEAFEWNTKLAWLYYYNHRFLLDSIVFRDSYSKAGWPLVFSNWADSSVISSCSFIDNYGGENLRLNAGSNDTYFVNNTIFKNLMMDTANPTQNSWSFSSLFQGRTIVANCLLEKNNYIAFSKQAEGGDAYLINCTFVNNSETDESPSIVLQDGNIHFYNSIAYNNYQPQFEVAVGEWQQMVHSYLNIHNSLIEGGEESISTVSSCWHDDTLWCHVYYDSTNIDADPNF